MACAAGGGARHDRGCSVTPRHYLCQLSLAGAVQGSKSSLPSYLCRVRNADLAEIAPTPIIGIATVWLA